MGQDKIWRFNKTFIILFLPLVGFLACSKGREAEVKTKPNSPPIISSVSILSEKPTKDKGLTVSIQSQDPDGDSVTYEYQWLKNDEEMIGQNQNTLKISEFKKGDIIQVKVTPSDEKDKGTPFLSPPVRILNSPPVIQEVWIEPKVAYVTDRLKANAKSHDSDGDFLYLNYQWEVNGVILSDEKESFLEKGRFKKGDSVAVIITPDDREILGTPKKSEAVIISNSPPLIISSPPTSIEMSTYIYQVKANDPDNDPYTFTLKSGPKRMEIDKNTGLIKWDIRKEDRGTHTVEIEVSDEAGAKSTQRYTLSIDFR